MPSKWASKILKRQFTKLDKITNLVKRKSDLARFYLRRTKTTLALRVDKEQEVVNTVRLIVAWLAYF